MDANEIETRLEIFSLSRRVLHNKRKKRMKIKSIHEAFSMQPASFRIGSVVGIKNEVLTELKEETIKINGDPFDVVVGYDQDGNKCFHYLKQSINIHYT